MATATAIVASQALISATFQIVKQAIAQGFFPRFAIKHTNAKHEGQIYVSGESGMCFGGMRHQILPALGRSARRLVLLPKLLRPVLKDQCPMAVS